MNLKLPLKFFLAPSIVGLSLCFFSPPSFAIPYPSKPITFVVTSSPGGGTDAMARVIAEAMSRDLGVPFLLKVFPGVSGNG